MGNGPVGLGFAGKKREIEKMEMANWAESKGIGLGQKKGRRERDFYFFKRIQTIQFKFKFKRI